LVVERLLLRRRKNVVERKKGAPVRGIRRMASGMMVPYKHCRAPASMAPFNPPWQGPIHVYRKGASETGALQCTKGASHRGAIA
jgi:hypothetical protein